MTKYILWLIQISVFLTYSFPAFNQVYPLHGNVSDQNGPLPGVTVQLLNQGSEVVKEETITNDKGHFHFDEISEDAYVLKLTHLGYKKYSKQLNVPEDVEAEINVHMAQDQLGLDQVVVSATRSSIDFTESPVLVDRLDGTLFESTQSASLAEGLSFSPGLRLETNCQNCGFTQVRMNGLGGAYSQILINNRPVISALAGVYGLELFPSNMIDKVEVVRGGGSALYGGNAIGGTINIITKTPVQNSFEIGTNYNSYRGKSPGYLISANGSLVSEDYRKGLSFYGFHRNRQPFDANGDGYSELTTLKNTTFGLEAFYELSNKSKIRFHLHQISEFRRGGNDFDLPPHQADVAEQLDHNMLGAGLTFESYFNDKKEKLSVYTSMQKTDRDSYYGAGGQILNIGDTIMQEDELALNAYGTAEDFAWVSGIQYSNEITKNLNVTLGSESQLNTVMDEIQGYERLNDQEVFSLGTYVQLNYKLLDDLSLTAGARYEYIKIDGTYMQADQKILNNKPLHVMVPRISFKYNPGEHWVFRASYSGGFRAPQAFDEDLHLETVGGAARMIRLSENLQTERSGSSTLSANYLKKKGSWQMNHVIELFYTRLQNPFVNVNPTELESGISVLTKTNGSGATVMGTNAEFNLAYKSNWMFQMGITYQQSPYDDPLEVWSPSGMNSENKAVYTDQILRTPNLYGFIQTNWNVLKNTKLSLNGTYTGSMKVPHIIDIESEYTIIETTPDFWDLSFRIAQEVEIDEQLKCTFHAGVQNIFDAYQSDFDQGADRDASYIYGPSRPRTYFIGMKVSL